MAIKLIKKALIGAFFITLFYTLPTSASAQCHQFTKPSATNLESDIVKWVVDGDTIHTRSGRKLRLLHINAPEINPKSNKPAEFYAIDSRNLLSQLTPVGSQIFWRYDQISKDKYGRELGLVFDKSGALVNLELVKLGAVSTLIVPPNQDLWHCFKEAQSLAKKYKRGLWKNPKEIIKQANELNSERNFQWVSGKISNVKDSKKYRWIILDDKLWVGIKRSDFGYFSQPDIQFKKGTVITVGGYLYQSYGKSRMNLRHPAMFSHD